MSTEIFAGLTPEKARLFTPDPPPQPARKRLAELVDGRPVLDIGCGRAEEIGDLYTPEQYIGIDCSPELVKLASEKWPGYRFERCAAQEIQSRHPVAIMKAVLEHVPPAEAKWIYDHVRMYVDTLYLCWHWEPTAELKETFYVWEGVPMQQNRHARSMFDGVIAREEVPNHVIWTVAGR